ncbi:MAG: ribonuclease III [Paracoccaceae bacterium]|nr:ribonuclease III [Paracoccaceae bacterium]MDE2913122.1 ribonuclease III [Paracoccaceae bacterium]
MTLPTELRRLSDRIGYGFCDPARLVEALTHPSARQPDTPDNQRLEFLGDRVIGLVMATAVMDRDPGADEGILAVRFNALVRGETCVRVAEGIDLGAVLRCDQSVRNADGQPTPSALGDGLEALVAAVYLDGGFEQAAAMVRRLWDAHAGDVTGRETNAKGRLQEWAQARDLPLPEYRQVRRRGPDHAPVFVVEAVLADRTRGCGEASSIRKAEQRAAAAVLATVESGHEP